MVQPLYAAGHSGPAMLPLPGMFGLANMQLLTGACRACSAGLRGLHPNLLVLHSRAFSRLQAGLKGTATTGSQGDQDSSNVLQPMTLTLGVRALAALHVQEAAVTARITLVHSMCRKSRGRQL